MKAVINEKETPKGEYHVFSNHIYPKIMKGKISGSVVIFFSRVDAIYLVSGDQSGYEVGEYDPCATIENFTPFTGSITLSND